MINLVIRMDERDLPDSGMGCRSVQWSCLGKRQGFARRRSLASSRVCIIGIVKLGASDNDSSFFLLHRNQGADHPWNEITVKRVKIAEMDEYLRVERRFLKFSEMQFPAAVMIHWSLSLDYTI